ncbi:MAG: YjgN family protein [Desulfosudis oleivorans]|nr:YjgN family protein [Desulfosudis oleivorans]
MFNARNSSLAQHPLRLHGRTTGEAFKVYILWPPLADADARRLLSPYVFYRQKKFLVENSSFGRTPLQPSTPRGSDYYRILMAASLAGAPGGGGARRLPPSCLRTARGPGRCRSICIVFAYFSVKTGNLLYNSTRLGRHRLESTMEVKGYLMLVLTNTLATALTLGLFHPWAKVRTLRYKARASHACWPPAT